MSIIKDPHSPKTIPDKGSQLRLSYVLWYITGLLVTGLLLSGAMIVVHDLFFESENEQTLRLENSLLEKHKPIIEQELSAVDLKLSRLKEQDKILYVRLFNAYPPDSSSLIPTMSKEQTVLADASDFRTLLDVLFSKAEKLMEKSLASNASFANRTWITKEQLEGIASIPAMQPIANAQLDLLVSGFGERINPFHKGRYNHPGVDFASPRGTKVLATAHGRVIAIKKTTLQAGYGNYIDVDHGNNFVTRYAHLEGINVRRGQYIDKGMVIGTIGNSGGSVAPHLHYEVIRDGEPVDPAPYIMEGLTSEHYSALLKLSAQQNQSLD
jgi:hypothetical protein